MLKEMINVLAVEPDNFSLSSMFKSVRLYGNETYIRVIGGKSVVIPSRVQTSWIHIPGIVDEPFYPKQLTDRDNVMLHFRGYLVSWRHP